MNWCLKFIQDDLVAVSKKIHELMEGSMTLDVPLLVEVGTVGRLTQSGMKLTKCKDGLCN